MKKYAPLLLLLLASPSFGADQQGRYMMGGGVGGVTCPQFLNLMATARQLGGVSTPSGVEQVSNFANYVTGFQTGYNLMSTGSFDIFAKLDTEHFDALYAIEAWCKDHPAAKFGEGVIALADKLAKHK
jgi:hypothetical protein